MLGGGGVKIYDVGGSDICWGGGKIYAVGG